MTFLDERIKFDVDWGSFIDLPEKGMYTYTLWAYDNHTTYDQHEVFVGNFYYNKTRIVTLDLTDIVRSSVNTLNASRQDLTNPQGISETVEEEIVIVYYVSINFNGTVKNSAVKPVANVYRYPNGSPYLATLNGSNTFFNPIGTYGNTTNLALQGILYGQSTGTGDKVFDLIPHYPLKNTINFAYAASFVIGENVRDVSIDIFDKALDYEEQRSIDAGQGLYSTTYIASINEFLEDYWYNREEYGYNTDVYIQLNIFRSPYIAIFDYCYKRYYLQWRDRFGSYQCQPMYEVGTYSEDIQTDEIVTYQDKRKPYNKQVQPKWKLNTGWIKDRYVPYYESIFVSPILIIYDTLTDKQYEVILKDNYTEKNYRNQKSLVNFEFEFEGVEKQNIIY